MKLNFYDFSTRKAKAIGEKLAFVIAGILAITLVLPGFAAGNKTAAAATPTAGPVPSAVPTQVPNPTPVPAEDKADEPRQNQVKPRRYRDNLGPDSVLSIENVSYYDFDDHGFSSEGVANHTDIPFDAYYGLKLQCIDDAVQLYWHDYTGSDVHPVAILATSPVDDFSQELGVDFWDEGKPYKLNTNIIPNGPYQLETSWSNGENTAIWFYKNGDTNWFCRADVRGVDYIYRWMNRKDQLANIIDASGTTPENSLDDSDQRWAYPVPASYDQSKYRCDNQRWRDLADQLVPDKSLPDGHKLAVIHDWMVQNLAYDNYKLHVLKDSRAKYYQDYTGTYSMYDTHVGVCADFATVYCIMLRHLGVPVIGIDEDDVHVWNVAYVDGRWVEIDLTYDIDRHVDGKDVSDVKTGNTDTYMTFGRPFSEEYLYPGRNRVNWGMYTYKVVTGTGHD